MNFVLFVEGETEAKALPSFLKRWLDPRLSQPVGVKVVTEKGWARYLKDIPVKVALHLGGHTGRDTIGAIGLLDLYGPTFYPAGQANPAQRRAWAKQWIEKQVGSDRFRQHFAVHEVEAWLLAAPQIFPHPLPGLLAGRAGHPETVNFDEPPARLLDKLYRQRLSRPYRKVIDGADLFRALPPETAYTRCPSLRALLDDMLEMAARAGLA